MAKKAYPYTQVQDDRSNVLMAELETLVKREEQIKKELRSIIYSAEKPR